jgi:hypothetical protein
MGKVWCLENPMRANESKEIRYASSFYLELSLIQLENYLSKHLE